MTDLQLELTRLIGSKELTLGCIVNPRMDSDGYRELLTMVDQRNFCFQSGFQGKMLYDIANDEIIGHPATLSDLHRWLNDSTFNWFQSNRKLTLQGSQKKGSGFIDLETSIVYDSSIGLLDQSESTLQAIINLIKEHEKDSMEAN